MFKMGNESDSNFSVYDTVGLRFLLILFDWILKSIDELNILKKNRFMTENTI